MNGTEQFIIALFIGTPAVLTAIASLIKSIQTGNKVDKLHDSVNGRMSQLIDAKTREAHAQGVHDGAAAVAAANTVNQGHPAATGAELE